MLHRIGAQRRVEQGRYALVGLGPAVGAGKDLLDDLAEFRIVRLARGAWPRSARAGCRASCCPSPGSIGAASRWARGEQTLPHRCPRLHAGTSLPVIIHDCLAFSANCTQEETVRGQPRYFPPGTDPRGEPQCSIAHGDGLQPTRTALRRRTTARPGQAVARLQARAHSRAGELGARRSVGAGAQAGDAARRHHRPRHGPVDPHRLRLSSAISRKPTRSPTRPSCPRRGRRSTSMRPMRPGNTTPTSWRPSARSAPPPRLRSSSASSTRRAPR